MIDIFLPQIEYVYFDFDNVLAKRVRNRATTLANALNVDSAEQVRDFYIYGFKKEPKLLKQYLAILTINEEIDFYEALFNLYTKSFGGQRDKHLLKAAATQFVHTPFSVIDGVDTCLQQLGIHYRLGILSNGLPARNQDIIASGLKKYFTTVLVSTDYKVEKPHLELYTVAIEKARVSAQAVALVDDEPANIEGAIQAGFGQAILFKPAFWQQVQQSIA